MRRGIEGEALGCKGDLDSRCRLEDAAFAVREIRPVLALVHRLGESVGSDVFV
jgi:hypothetical protein